MSRVSLFRRPGHDAHLVVPGLWVGSAPSHRAAHQLSTRIGIDAVVDLRAEWRGDDRSWPEGVTVLHSPLTDHGTPSPEQLGSVAMTVVGLMRQGREVLVHCHAGIERGPTVACAALVLTGWSLADAYNRVLGSHPRARPTEGQMEALRLLATAYAP